MIKRFIEKCLDNIGSYKFLIWAVATLLFIFTDKIPAEYWIAFSGVLMGARVFEYFKPKN